MTTDGCTTINFVKHVKFASVQVSVVYGVRILPELSQTKQLV